MFKTFVVCATRKKGLTLAWRLQTLHIHAISRNLVLNSSNYQLNSQTHYLKPAPNCLHCVELQKTALRTWLAGLSVQNFGKLGAEILHCSVPSSSILNLQRSSSCNWIFSKQYSLQNLFLKLFFSMVKMFMFPSK